MGPISVKMRINIISGLSLKVTLSGQVVSPSITVKTLNSTGLTTVNRQLSTKRYRLAEPGGFTPLKAILTR